MRTLKKSLALVLVVALVLSFGVIGASASDFTDTTDSNYTAAIDVLSGIGVINGMTATTFEPTGSLTRAQAAKIVAYLKLGPTNAELISSATSKRFSDVPTTHWAAGYIEYCANLGIITGVGDGKFDPEGKLTTAAFTKMLLVAVGFDPTESGFTGESWSINVAATALKADIYDSSIAISPVTVCTREQAAQLAFNALFYGEKVSTTGTKYVILASTGSNVPTNVGSIYDSYSAAVTATTTATPLAVLGVDYTISAITATTTETKDSLALDVFSLKEISAQSDGFGRPATKYVQTVKKVDKTIATVTTEPVATYTTAVSATTLYNLLGSSAIIDHTGSSYSTTTKTANTLYINGSTSTSDVTVASNAYALGGNGIVTEIYATDTTNHYVVVQIHPTLAQVGTITKTLATKTEGAYTTYTIAGTGYKVYTSEVSGNETDTVTLNGAIVKGDWVMIYGNGSMAYVTPAELVTGKLTGYTSPTNAYTIAGAAYVKSAAVAGSGVTTTFIAYNTTATYALDTYGNVVGSVTVTLPSNYVFVLAADTAQYLNASTNKVETVVEATVITTDGSLSTIKVDASVATDLDTVTSGAQGTGLFTYTVNTDGEYVLTTNVGAEVAQIVKSNAILKTSSLYADSATKFYVAQKTDGKYTGVSVYTGYANVPSLTLPTNVKAIDADSNNVAEVVFVDATVETGVSTSYIYLTGSYTSDGTYYYYDYVQDGTASTSPMKLQSGLSAGLYTVSSGTATSVTGTAALDISNGTDGKYTSTYFSYENGLLKTSSTVAGTYSYLSVVGADVPVYTFDSGVCTASTAGDLSAATGSLVVVAVNAAHTAISAIYIVK